MPNNNQYLCNYLQFRKHFHMYYSSSCQLDKWVMILTPFFRPGNKNSEILSDLLQITQLLIWTVFKFQMGILSTTFQAVDQHSLINTWTRISLSDHLMLLWKMQKGLMGTGNILGRFDKEGPRKQVHMAVWEGGGQEERAAGGGGSSGVPC